MFFVILDTNSLVIPSEGKEKLGFGHCKEFEVMWTNLLRIRKITWSVFRYIAQWYCFNVVIWERNKRKKEENNTQENGYMSNPIHGNLMRAFDWLNERLASCNIQTARVYLLSAEFPPLSPFSPRSSFLEQRLVIRRWVNRSQTSFEDLFYWNSEQSTVETAPSNIRCSNSSLSLLVFAPYLLVSFNPLISFCFCT